MIRVVLESPFAGNVERNIAYAKLCIKDCLLRDEAPIASHLLFTQPGILDDTKPEERKLGIDAGHQWIDDKITLVVYVDYGVSSGMRRGIEVAKECDSEIEYRYLPLDVLKDLEKKYE